MNLQKWSLNTANHFCNVGKIKNLKQAEEIEFITEIASQASTPNEIPGFLNGKDKIRIKEELKLPLFVSVSKRQVIPDYLNV